MDYRVANIRKKELELRQTHHAIISSESQEALNMILEAKSPAALIQSFPDQDLYYLMHKIGPYDFLPVLSMATSDQWEHIIDLEVWDKDRVDIKNMAKVFDLLYKADPERLLRWAILEKPDFFEFFLSRNMTVKMREHDEPPPSDFDDYITVDDKFYFRFPEKADSGQSTDDLLSEDQDEDEDRSADACELIEEMLKKVASMDLSVYHGLLLETESVLPAEVEEEQFRLKNERLAEKGFLSYHEAIGIYQPAKIESLRHRPAGSLIREQNFDPDLPLPPQFFTGFFESGSLFVNALKLFDTDAGLVLESELAALINKVISADKIKLREKEDIEKAVKKTCDYLNLGLEIMLKGDRKGAAAKSIIETYFLEDIFRTGSRAGLKLQIKAVNWFKNSFMNKNSLPLSFLDKDFMGVAGGLFLDRPLYYDNFSSGSMYRDFKTTADIKNTDDTLEKIAAVDHMLGKIKIDISTFTYGFLTWKTLVLTLWAKDRIGLPLNLEAISTREFKDFFAALFQQPENAEKNFQIQTGDLVFWVAEQCGVKEKELPPELAEVLRDLIMELEDEYGRVRSGDIDPRFIPHFLLKHSDKK